MLTMLSWPHGNWPRESWPYERKSIIMASMFSHSLWNIQNGLLTASEWLCILTPCYSASEHQKQSQLLYLGDLVVHVTILYNGKEENKYRHKYMWNTHMQSTTACEGCFNWAQSMHSEILKLFCATQEWSGSRSWYSLRGFKLLVTKLSLWSIQCA